jgi:hypothetical protein
LTGRRAYDDAMQTYQRMRDDAAPPMYELTCEIVSLEPPPPDFAELLAAAAQDQSAMDDFASNAASAASSPVSRLVASRRTTSSEDIACHGVAFLAVFAFATVSMAVLRFQSIDVIRRLMCNLRVQWR